MSGAGADVPLVLALDLASGGVTAALVSADLETLSSAESPWCLVDDGAGSVGIAPTAAWDHVVEAVRPVVASGRSPSAIVLTSMMHTLVVVDPDGTPRGPVRTWRDRGHVRDLDRDRFNLEAYRERTGCYIHPSFPATKLMSMRERRSRELNGRFRLESIKGYVHRRLTGTSVEDISTASASGLVDLATGTWDTATLDALGLLGSNLPPIVPVDAIAGELSDDAARILELTPGTRVVAGIGDGFAATAGSGAEHGGAIAVTLGTTSSVRTVISSAHPVPDGTFCYRWGPARYLVGCASSNGGNLLDWSRETFPSGDGGAAPEAEPDHGLGLPLFLPFLEGERSPFWNAALEPRWVDVEETRSVNQLSAAVVESAVFVLRSAFGRLRRLKPSACSAVISGNGFRNRALGHYLADLIDVPLLEPPDPGLATSRGAAVTAFRALGIDTTPALASLLGRAAPVLRSPDEVGDPRRQRYERFEKRMNAIEAGTRIRPG